MSRKPTICAIKHYEPAKVRFEFSHAAIFGGGPVVEWIGKKSQFRWRESYDPTWHELPVPADLQWKAFWLLLEQSGARNWDADYTNPDILDGIGWDFKLTAPGRRIESSGSNSYPGSDSFESSAYSPFDILITAIGILVGRDVHTLKRHE